MSAIRTSTSCLELASDSRERSARCKAYKTCQGNLIGRPFKTVLHNAACKDVDPVVLQAMKNDVWAQSQLFTQHRSQLYRRAYSILRDREDAEDALQDSWLRALRNLPSFQGRSSFSTWLTRIVINSALMILRKKRNSREMSFDVTDESVNAPEAWRVPAVSPDAEQIMAKREEVAMLERAICALRPRFRQVAELVQLRGLTTTEAALALGISETAAKGRLFHARRTLRKSILCVDSSAHRRPRSRTNCFKEVRR